MTYPHGSHAPHHPNGYGQGAPQGYAVPYGGAGGIAKKRNVALILIGCVLILLALIPAGLFLYNLWQYATVEDRWASNPRLSSGAIRFGTRIVKDAAVRRMTMFGPVAMVLGLAGLVTGGLGLRKK
jgi:hypothetical protein